MNWSGFLKSASVFLAAIALIAGGGFFGFQYLMTQLTSLPPKPVFPNDKPLPSAKNAAAVSAKPATAIAPTAKPSPSASPTANPAATNYQARITLDNGLNVRDNPSADAARIGGVDYDQVILVLENSSDQEWQHIRVEASGLEGWIKSGHTERVNAAPLDQPTASPSPQPSPVQ